jgi:hypothetical protein
MSKWFVNLQMQSTEEQLEALADAGYEVKNVLEHQHMVAFVRSYLFRRDPLMLFYWLFNLLVVVMALVFLLRTGVDMDFLLDFLLGLGIFFLLIPLHEWIHGLGYRMAGAPQVSYKVIWRQLVFYAMADRFVVRKKAFVGMALAPFGIINSGLLMLLAFGPQSIHGYLLGVLFMHTSGCAGDFVLVSYFHSHWRQDPLTFDDVPAQKTYFLVKRN